MEDNTEGIPKIKYPIVPYNPPLTAPLRYYLLAQWLILISCALRFDAGRQYLPWPYFICYLAYLIVFLQIFGYYFDQSRLSVAFDSARLGFVVVAGLFTSDVLSVIYGIVSLAVVYELKSTGNILTVEKQKQ
ncbi:hypothetical protein OESDEN_24601 [Oesophagostomum dentatum]|uniref:Uncharacterized protein n=1 Tax=Oesophagostomum dentatum TaxID=61180 RepID=A0A0B1RRV1_OESDE|nr:hypothetical protein OESDEN_24601 [Oesophagostomum dentatum]